MPNVFVAEDGFDEVPDDLVEAFVVAANGCFHVRRLSLDTEPFAELTFRTGDGFGAEGMERWRATEGLTLRAPKIARATLEEVESFFRAVYDTHRAEAICLLYVTPANGGLWRFIAPEQTVTGGSAHWTSPGPAPNGWFLAGSFHSHGSMSAFHSGTDDSDELGWDGVHVTVGKINSPRPEYAASIVMGGRRHEVEIDDLVASAPPVDFPADWMTRVSKPEPVLPVLPGHVFVPRHGGGHSRRSLLYGGVGYGE